MKDLKSNANPDIKIFLIGNKADLEEERLVTKEQGLQFAKDFELDLFMEISTKTGFDPQQLFIEAGKIRYDDYIKHKQKQKRPAKRADQQSNLKFDELNEQINLKFKKLNKYINF